MVKTGRRRKAWEVTIATYGDIFPVYADTARNAAKAAYYLCLNQGRTLTLKGCKPRRNKDADVILPLPDPDLILTEDQQRVLLHTLGGGPYQSPYNIGHRNYYTLVDGSLDAPVVGKLASLGLMKSSDQSENGHKKGMMRGFIATERGRSVAMQYVPLYELRYY